MGVLDFITNNPILMVFGLVGILVIVGLPVLLFMNPTKKNFILTLVFDRNSEFEFTKAESVAGIASYGRGGYDITESAMFPYVVGSTKLELGKVENRKETKPLYCSRVGDTGAIVGDKEGLRTTPMTKDEYRKRESLAAEIARNEAAIKITSIDLINVSLVVVMIILAIPLAAIGLRMAA